jgi:hypothetical protein
MAIEPRPTGSAARRVETLLLTGNAARETSLAGQVAVLEARRVPEEWAIAAGSVTAGSVIGAVPPADKSAIAEGSEPAAEPAIAAD